MRVCGKESSGGGDSFIIAFSSGGPTGWVISLDERGRTTNLIVETYHARGGRRIRHETFRWLKPAEAKTQIRAWRNGIDKCAPNCQVLISAWTILFFAWGEIAMCDVKWARQTLFLEMLGKYVRRKRKAVYRAGLVENRESQWNIDSSL